MELGLKDLVVFDNNPAFGVWNRFANATLTTTNALMMYVGSGNTLAHTSYNFASANASLFVASSDAADTGTLLVYGIKIDGSGNWVDFTEEVTMQGTTTVELTNTGIRVNRMKYISGSGSPAATSNAGNIFCVTDSFVAGVPATVAGILIGIPAGYSTSQGTVTTLGSDVAYGVVHGLYANGNSRNLSFELLVRDNTQTNPTFQKVGPWVTDGEDYLMIDFHYKIGPKTDVMLIGKSSDAVSKNFTSGYDIFWRKAAV